MLLTIIAPDIFNGYKVLAYALDSADLKDVYGKYYGEDVASQDTINHETKSRKKQVLTKTPSIINIDNQEQIGYEILSERSENTKTFQVDDKQVTEIYLDAIHKKIGNAYIEIDNTLEEKNTYFTNSFGLYNVDFHKNNTYLYSMTSSNNKTIKARFENGNVDNYAVNNNQILFSEVYNNIDVEYIVNNSYLKENILFTANQESDTFSYIMNMGELNAKKIDDYICLYTNNECDYKIIAPFMFDAENNLNLNVTIDYIKLDNNEIKIIITYDLDWVNDNERIYPITLDPTVASIAEEISVTSSFIRSLGPNTTSVYGHLFVGFDRDGYASSLGNPGMGLTRTFISFPMPNIGNNRIIESASLELNKFTNYYEATRTVDVYKTENFVDPTNVKWNNQPADNTLTFVSSNYVDGVGYKALDITSYIADLNAGEQKTLELRANDESSSYYPMVFYSEHTGHIPKITITHKESYDVASDLDINTFDNNLRVYAKNINEFEALSMDGIAKPNSTITFKLYKKDANGIKSHIKDFTTTSDYYFLNPIYITNPLSGVQTYIKEDINYTSSYHFKNEFTLKDTTYGYDIIINDGTNTNTNAYHSDEFMLYKVKLGDNLNSIASYYGITIDELVLDNNLNSSIIKENDILFIRFKINNPRLTPDAYKPKTTISNYSAEYVALANCRYSCEAADPINLFTGNFYYQSNDVSINDYDTINLTRTYNSKIEKYSESFGVGWSFNYDKYIAYDESMNMLFFKGDGSIIKINNISGTYTPNASDLLVVTKSGDEIHIKDLINLETSIFNKYGSLIRVKTNNNTTNEIIRNDYGNIEKIIINNNKTIHFNYNSYNLVSKIDLENTNSIYFEYNNKRELIKYTDALGYFEEYTYDTNSLLTSIKNKNGDVAATNTYDALSRVISQSDALGNVYTFNYEPNKTTYTYDGETKVVVYDSLYRLTKQTFNDNTTIQRTYDAKNNLIIETNSLGQTKTYDYDINNNLIKIKDYNQDITTYEYDTKGNIIKTTDSKGNIEKFSYDANNNITSYTDEFGYIYYTTYNSKNEMITQSDKYGNVTTYTYQNGNIKTITNPNNLIQTYYYDALGNITKITDNFGKSTQYIYDNNANLIKEIDSLNQTIEKKYDKNGNLIEELNKKGGKTTYTYDAQNRVIKITVGDESTTYEYNMNNQITKEVDSFNNETQYIYDQKGNLIETIDAKYNSHYKTYDEASNLIEEIDIYSNITKYTYTDGLLTKKILPNNTFEEYIYDSKNRLITTNYSNGLKEELHYDINNNLIKKIDKYENIYEYVYDQHKNIIKTTITYDNLTQITTNTYNKDLLIKSIEENGITTNYSYDTYGRLIKKQNSEGKILINEYDAYSNIIKITDEYSSSKTYKYDLLNRLIEETNFYGDKTKYEYDTLDNITKTTDAQNNFEETNYDNLGNKLKFTNKLNHQTIYTYIKGKLTLEINPYAEETNYEYNARGQLINIYKNNIKIKSYSYDEYGRIKSNTELDETINYEYNTFNNIVFEENLKTGIITEYEYDIYQNKILEKNNYNTNTTYSYDIYSRIIQTTDWNIVNRKDTKRKKIKLNYSQILFC